MFTRLFSLLNAHSSLELDWVGIERELSNQSVEVEDTCEAHDGRSSQDSEEHLEATSNGDVIPILQQEERSRGHEGIVGVLQEPRLKHDLVPFSPELMVRKKALLCKCKGHVHTHMHIYMYKQEIRNDVETPLQPLMVPVQVTESAHQVCI